MKKEENLIRIQAQVSVFVIFAIIIAAAIGVGYFISKSINQAKLDKEFFESTEVKGQVDVLKNSIKTCMSNSADECIFLLGVQGGYYNKPKEYFDLGWAFIPYYYKNGIIMMPDKSKIEGEMSLCFNDMLLKCLNDVDKKGFDLKFQDFKTKTQIKEKEVFILTESLSSISKEKKTITFNLNSNPVLKNSKFYDTIELAKYSLEYHKSEPELLCINCLVNFAEQKGLLIDYINSGNNARLVVISENSKEIIPFSLEFLEETKGGNNNVAIPKVLERTA